MPEAVTNIPHIEILTYEEIIRLSSIMTGLGIQNIKITGGEPLVRKDICYLIQSLKLLPGIKSVTMTTNGVLLEDHLEKLVQAGLDGVNISLDTLNKETFEQITGVDALDKVLSGIDKVLQTPIKVKINCVPIAGVNEEDIIKLAGWTLTKPVDVRYIEMMPIGAGRNFQTVDGEQMLKQVERVYGPFNLVSERRGNGPASYYKNVRMQGCIGIINAVNHNFCSSCNRIRLTSEGFLKQCLYYNQGVDLKYLLRNGSMDEEIKSIIQQAIKEKPEKHHFENKTSQTETNLNKPKSGLVKDPSCEIEDIENKKMSQIGG